MRIYLIILITIFVTSCSPQPVSVPTSAQTPLSMDMAPTVTTPELVREKMIARVVGDLSIRLSLDLGQIRVISVEETQWPDAALGCRHPAEVSAEQMEPGYRIVLEANGQEYTYRTDTHQTVILCLEEELPSFPVTPGEIDEASPWMPVN